MESGHTSKNQNYNGKILKAVSAAFKIIVHSIVIGKMFINQSFTKNKAVINRKTVQI